jgi:hypothetical protein
MTTVFLSGSRTLGRLNGDVRERLRNIVDQSFHVVIGDANGADKALQKYFADAHYPSVTVYCSGGHCRNNVGAWGTRSIDVDPRLSGRDFYVQKDKSMAEDADYGFVLWDGKSAGALGNVMELLKRRKKALVYLSPTRSFLSVVTADDFRTLLANCTPEAQSQINKKIKLTRSLDQLERDSQGLLAIQ